MKTLKIVSIILAVIFLFSRCDDFGDVNVDPNNPSQANTRSLFLYAAFYVPYFGWVSNYDPWTQLYPQYVTERSNVQYTKFLLSAYSLGNYQRLGIRNLEDIINYNQDEGTKSQSWVLAFGSNNNQIAVAHTLRGFL